MVQDHGPGTPTSTGWRQWLERCQTIWSDIRDHGLGLPANFGWRWGLARCQNIWSNIRAIFHGLSIAWVSTASVLAGLALLWTLQAQDLFLEVQGNWGADLFFWGWFYVSVIGFWALPVFISARWILTRFEEGERQHPHVRPVPAWVRGTIPPLLAASCFLAVFVGQFMASWNAPTIKDPNIASLVNDYRTAYRKEAERLKNVCREQGRESKPANDQLVCEPGAQVVQFIRNTVRSMAGKFNSVTANLIIFVFAIIAWIWFFLKRSSRRLRSDDSISKLALIWPLVAALIILFSASLWLAPAFALIGVGLQHFSGIDRIVEIMLVPGAVFVLLIPVVLLLLWLGKRHAVCRTTTICWWIGTVLLFVPVALVIVFLLASFLYIGTQSTLQLWHLALLPAVTLGLAYIAWDGLKPQPGGRATKFGQLLLRVQEGTRHSAAMATLRLVNPIFYSLLIATLVIMFFFIFFHPLRVTSWVYRALLFPVILGLPVAVITYVTHWSLRCRAPLVIGSVIVIGAALGVLVNDPYEVRTVDKLDGGTPRYSLEATVEHWARVNKCDLPTLSMPVTARKCPAPIIVAAAGGASRAAFFTASAIGTLMDETRVSPLRGHKGSITSVTFSPDGTGVLTVSRDKTARIWDARTGLPLVIFKGQRDGFTSAVFSPDGRFVLTLSRFGTMRIWNAQTGAHIKRLRGFEDLGHKSAVFSPDGTRVLADSTDDIARIWNVVNRDVLFLKGHDGNVRSAVFSPDGMRVLTASSDKTARIWDAQSGKELEKLVGHEGPVLKAVFSPDGRRVLTVSADGTVRIWNPQKQNAKTIATIEGRKILIGKDKILNAVFSPDGRRVLTISFDKTAQIWDAADRKTPPKTLKGHERRIVSAVFSSPDGKRILTASRDKTARIWDAQSGASLVTISGHSGPVKAAVFNKDGTRIVTMSDDGAVRLWNGVTGAPIEGADLAAFSKRLFAISAVSGGSLGAVVTYAALADSQLPERSVNKPGNPPCKAGVEDWDWFATAIAGEPGKRRDINPQKSWRDCLQLLLAGDFLSPVFVSLVSNDPFRISLRGNRADVLEQAWEVRYARLTGQGGDDHGLGYVFKTDNKDLAQRSTLARSMTALRSSVLKADETNNWLPILLLNGTSATNGRRIIVSDVDTLTRDENGEVTRRVFRDAYDLHELLERPKFAGRCESCDVRLSTAATTSARFPFISPPGHIMGADSKISERVVDGGYFENFGATTAMELAAKLRAKPWDLKPLVILINNEPFKFGMACVEDTKQALPQNVTDQWFPSITATYEAVMSTRTARGTHAADTLCNIDKENFAFITVDPKGSKNLSMSWWLSKNVQIYLDQQTVRVINATAFRKINKTRH